MPIQGFHELLLPEELDLAETLLRQANLDMPGGVTFALGCFEDNALTGAGFLAGNVLCGICVAANRQGEGLAASITDHLVRQALREGMRHLLLFTRPSEAPKFADLGFQLLISTEAASLLEWGTPDYAEWLSGTRSQAGLPAPPDRCPAPGAVVMNANPFTLGHRRLVLAAREQRSRVLVFVVREEASAFPFAARLDLVREGLADLDGVAVLSGGPYMVSRASFPSYFTGRTAHARTHAELDCALFARRIAPDLGIDLRVVGEEPLSPVTACYNEVMRDVLPRHGIQCLELPRLTALGGPISASRVRELLRRGDEQVLRDQLPRLVPASTLAFLRSPAALPVVERLRRGVEGEENVGEGEKTF